ALDIAALLAEVFAQCLVRFIHRRHEDETLPDLHRHPLQTVLRLVDAEETLLVADIDQVALEVEGPAVEAAHEEAVAAPLAAVLRDVATVGADIVEGVDLALAVPAHQHLLAEGGQLEDE